MACSKLVKIFEKIQVNLFPVFKITISRKIFDYKEIFFLFYVA